ncbi:carbohydrate ABC transporter permease [Paenibacillus flagellatus]|uniref:Sugar ABC transporter permease n=1 Tax=Paenibacillus flagellatus TaxID=2211139 RepID=A0A2V5KB92_9BACL|nr:sugar ABC transporter permease [Paenibacillus flagellatus]PYI56182.1 sugar ABC transporter permease [Paenibacillus flagellatus]
MNPESNAETVRPWTWKEHEREQRRLRRRTAMTGLLFLMPWLVGTAAFMAYPLAYSLYLSFHTVGVKPDGSGLKYDFAGWDNYKYAFLRDNVFPEQMFLYVREALLVIPLTVLFALLVSVMLNRRFYGRLFFRTIFFLPVIFASGNVLTELFAQGQGSLPFAGQLDVAEALNRSLPAAIAAPLASVLSRFVILLWFSGVQVILFLAGFQTIPASAYEAARIDGATPWESFWRITFPSIVPFIGLNLIYTVVDQSTNPFNPIMTHILSNVNNPKTGYGYASALGWLYCGFIMALIAVLLRMAVKWNGKREVKRT